MEHPADGLRFAFGENHYRDKEKFGPLLGCQIEIVNIRSGQVQVIADGQSFDVTAPAILLAVTSRHLEYRYQTDDLCKVLWCQCLGPDLTGDVIERFRPFSGVLPATELSTGLMRLGAELPLRVSDEMPEFVSSLAETLLLELFYRRQCGTPLPDVPPRVSSIRRYIEENFDKDIGMKELSGKFSLSPQYINRLFQASFGRNALDYLWHLRVRQGAFMLRHTGMQISQIAYSTGFKTPNHFSRLIKEEYGLSPRDLRTRDWEGGR